MGCKVDSIEDQRIKLFAAGFGYHPGVECAFKVIVARAPDGAGNFKGDIACAVEKWGKSKYLDLAIRRFSEVEPDFGPRARLPNSISTAGAIEVCAGVGRAFDHGLAEFVFSREGESYC